MIIVIIIVINNDNNNHYFSKKSKNRVEKATLWTWIVVIISVTSNTIHKQMIVYVRIREYY